MDERIKAAYRLVLAAGMVHLKWDLAQCTGPLPWVRPYRLFQEMRAARRAAMRSAALHNLALFSSKDFEGFSEERFWRDIAEFQGQYPNDITGNYRLLFDRIVRGEEVQIIRPGG